MSRPTTPQPLTYGLPLTHYPTTIHTPSSSPPTLRTTRIFTYSPSTSHKWRSALEDPLVQSLLGIRVEGEEPEEVEAGERILGFEDSEDEKQRVGEGVRILVGAWKRVWRRRGKSGGVGGRSKSRSRSRVRMPVHHQHHHNHQHHQHEKNEAVKKKSGRERLADLHVADSSTDDTPSPAPPTSSTPLPLPTSSTPPAPPPEIEITTPSSISTSVSTSVRTSVTSQSSPLHTATAAESPFASTLAPQNPYGPPHIPRGRRRSRADDVAVVLSIKEKGEKKKHHHERKREKRKRVPPVPSHTPVSDAGGL